MQQPEIRNQKITRNKNIKRCGFGGQFLFCLFKGVGHHKSDIFEFSTHKLCKNKDKYTYLQKRLQYSFI